MTLHARDYPLGSAIYTFIEEETGKNIHVDSEKLRIWCAKHHPETFQIPVDPALIPIFLDTKAISWENLSKVARMAWDPVIFGKVGTFTNGAPDCILIDGHHRYMIAVMRKKPTILGYLLEPSEWQEFQIEGFPDLTLNELRQRPVKGAKNHD